MVDPSAAFQIELETFRIDHEQATQFFYAFEAVHATAARSKPVYNLLDGSALFWNTILGGLQTSTFIALGRVFDTNVPHGVYRALRIAEDHPEIFVKSHHGWTPAPKDFRRLRTHFQRRKSLYEQKYDPVRDHFAHRLMTDSEAINVVVAAVNLRELERVLAFLASFYSALWHAFANGLKPVLSPRRYSAARMRRREPSDARGVSERITHEAERFLRAAASVSRNDEGRSLLPLSTQENLQNRTAPM